MNNDNKRIMGIIKVDCVNLEKVMEVMKIANNSIYIGDSTDYLSDLFKICTILIPEELHEEIGKKYLD